MTSSYNISVNKNQETKYYTTLTTQRYMIALLLVIGINILVSWTITTLYMLIGLGIFYVFIFGKITVYIFKGINYKGVDGILYSFLSFAVILIINYISNMKIAIIVSSISSLPLIGVLIYININKINGDNLFSVEDNIDEKYYDYISDMIDKFKVSFPLDIGNYKKDRALGNIISLGVATKGKYLDRIAVLVKNGNGTYIVPVKYLKLEGVPKKFKNQKEILLAETADQKYSITLYIYNNNGIVNGTFSVVGNNTNN